MVGLERQMKPCTLRVYHGTQSEKVASIKKQGLKTPPGVMPSRWYMVTTQKAGAAHYSAGTGEPVVIEYRIPCSEVERYLWPPGESSTEGTFYGIRKPLPGKYIKGVTKVRR